MNKNTEIAFRICSASILGENRRWLVHIVSVVMKADDEANKQKNGRI